MRADIAETDKLDFEAGEWRFAGNVEMEADGTRLLCDEAVFVFREHQLLSAILKGSPARFEQPAVDTQRVNSGAAGEIAYDLAAGTLTLTGKATFSDSVNEISGDKIAYDITRGRLTAGSGDSGPVKILIEPPVRDEGAPQEQ